MTAMYSFIAEEKAGSRPVWSVAEMCRTLEVSRQGFYDWESRAPSDRELTDRMAALQEALKLAPAEAGPPSTGGSGGGAATTRSTLAGSGGSVHRTCRMNATPRRIGVDWLGEACPPRNEACVMMPRRGEPASETWPEPDSP